MQKIKIKYVCTNCGFESPKWLGKCPDCGSWNTFSEEKVSKTKNNQQTSLNIKPVKITDIKIETEERIITNIGEYDRVMGGGIMKNSITLVGGDPGIGKSTLLMQVADKINKTVLYVSAEESANQIKQRANRTNINNEHLYVLTSPEVEIIMEKIKELKPELVIIDSIQTIYLSSLENSPGTVTQIKECAQTLIQEAKSKGFCLIFIGHVTKEGNIAGPMVLEHMVDTVLFFEGDKNLNFRIIRSLKNRFGSTNEIGVFQMTESGLVEVKNPGEFFLSDEMEEVNGSVVTAVMEGSRPILLEVQALTTKNNFGIPQRVATGFDLRKLSIIVAVLEKRLNLKLSTANIFINMVGGIKIDDPAADLAVCCGIISSFLNLNVKSKIVVVGEIGLSGEVRAVTDINKRISEAEKLGFETIYIPKQNFKNIEKKFIINVIPIKNIKDITKDIFYSN